MRTATLTVAARIIGCVCLLGSVMIATQIAVDLFHFSNPAYSNTTKWAFKSIDVWTVHHAHQFVDKESHLLAVGIFVVFYGVCSGLLVYATYVGRRLLAEPWLFCEGTCILCEASSLVAYYMRKEEVTARWNATGALLCLALAGFMWGLVFEAQLRWKTEAFGERTVPSPPPYTEHSLEQPHALHAPGKAHRAKMTVV
ncbi:Uncharacterized protein GBIM_06128 [Gryllus bimaculatus]|nr:Uncharacterized protein GBIM_06128 [Gryllus bimaculatus]